MTITELRIRIYSFMLRHFMPNSTTILSFILRGLLVALMIFVAVSVSK